MAETNNNLNKTDEELVGLALQNKEYYRYLVERYEGKLGRYIFRIISVNQEDQKDILQEVFIKVYKNLNDFEQSLKFSSWIYRIAHNEAINFLRKNKNKTSVLNFELDKTLIEAAQPDLDMIGEIDKKYFTEKIKKILDSFDNKNYREVLILRYLESKDYQEISDILKKPMGTVATLLSRAKNHLKEEILKNNKIILS